MKKISLIILLLLLGITGCNVKKTYVEGTITDSTYHSDYFGISFELIEGYTFLTEEEMQQIGVNVEEITVRNSIEKLYEFVVEDELGKKLIFFYSQEIESKPNFEEIAEVQIEEIRENYNLYGAEIKIFNQEETILSEKEVYYFEIGVTYARQTILRQRVYLWEQNDRLVVLSFSISGNDSSKIDELVQNFKFDKK